MVGGSCLPPCVYIYLKSITLKPYDSYRYLYPPRPEIKAPPTSLGTYERMGFWAQPKLNGSCSLLFLDGKTARMMNRHSSPFAHNSMSPKDLTSLHSGAGWMVLVGEYMNKSQRDAQGKVFNSKLVIFDILVHKGQYLLDSTFAERQQLLDRLYPSESYDPWMDRISDSIYRARCLTHYSSSWKEITSIGMYEGYVLKKPDAKLGTGYSPANNTGWQVKIRKPTKNYSY